MTNTGLPSLACRTCKARKVRCDARRPTCIHCASAGRLCGGYDHGSSSDRLFKDQTLVTVEKAARRGSASSKIRSRGSRPRNTRQPKPSPDLDDIDAQTKLGRPLFDASHDIESRILVFFLDNMSLSIGPQEALRIFLQGADSSSGSSGQVLASSLRAIALGAAWKIAHNKNLRQSALDQYVTSMRSVEQALSESSLSTSDELLLSVKLLELFECLCSEDPSNHAWARHAIGSVSLVRWRGRKNFETLMGRSLFHSVRFITIMTCIHYSENVPPYRDGESWTHSSSPSGREEPAQALMRIATQVAALKADVRILFDDPHMAYDDGHRLDLMLRVDELDGHLLEWRRNLPDVWQSHRVTIDENHGRREDRKTWKGVVYVHENVWISAHVTTFHALRLHVSATRLRLLNSLQMHEESGTSTYDCLYCLQQLADIICACVAPAVEDVVPKDKIPAGTKAEDISGRAVYVKMWLLATVARLEIISAEQRQWVVNRMAILSTRYGLNMATVLSHWPANLVEQDISEPDGQLQRRLFVEGLQIR